MINPFAELIIKKEFFMKNKKILLTALAIMLVFSMAVISCGGGDTDPNQQSNPSNPSTPTDPTNPINPTNPTDPGTITSVNIEMVSIPAGTFMMGSPDTEVGRYNNETQHSVTLSAFSIGKYEVTQEQWEAVMGSNPSYFTSSVSGESGTPGKLPVERVSWYKAIVFCNRLSIKEGLAPVYSIGGSTDPTAWEAVPIYDPKWDAVVMDKSANGYRLPTEAEWEYACRAGTTTAFNNGNDDCTNSSSINTIAWWYNNSGYKTHKVGEKQPNAWGLYDMHGNVWEWCWDWYGDYSSSAQTDPTGAVTGSSRMLRGGSWRPDDGMDRYLRSAFRYRLYPVNGLNYFGLRLVRSSN